MAESLMYKGSLEGHRNWVTAIAANPENAAMLLTASRDHTIIVWRLERDDVCLSSLSSFSLFAGTQFLCRPPLARRTRS